jgi:hypothetical protein
MWSRDLLEKLRGSHVRKIFPKFYWICVCKSLPLFPAVNQMNPINSLPAHCVKAHFNIILSYLPRSPKCLFFSDFPTKTTCPHVPPTSSTLIWSPAQYLMRSTNHTAPLYISFSILLILPPSGQSIFLSTMFISINNSKLLLTPRVKMKESSRQSRLVVEIFPFIFPAKELQE